MERSDLLGCSRPCRRGWSARAWRIRPHSRRRSWISWRRPRRQPSAFVPAPLGGSEESSGSEGLAGLGCADSSMSGIRMDLGVPAVTVKCGERERGGLQERREGQSVWGGREADGRGEAVGSELW